MDNVDLILYVRPGIEIKAAPLIVERKRIQKAGLSEIWTHNSIYIYTYIYIYIYIHTYIYIYIHIAATTARRHPSVLQPQQQGRDDHLSACTAIVTLSA